MGFNAFVTTARERQRDPLRCTHHFDQDTRAGDMVPHGLAPARLMDIDDLPWYSLPDTNSTAHAHVAVPRRSCDLDASSQTEAATLFQARNSGIEGCVQKDSTKIYSETWSFCSRFGVAGRSVNVRTRMGFPRYIYTQRLAGSLRHLRW